MRVEGFRNKLSGQFWRGVVGFRVCRVYRVFRVYRGLQGFIGFTGFVGFIRFKGFMGFIGFIGFRFQSAGKNRSPIIHTNAFACRLGSRAQTQGDEGVRESGVLNNRSRPPPPPVPRRSLLGRFCLSCLALFEAASHEVREVGALRKVFS